MNPWQIIVGIIIAVLVICFFWYMCQPPPEDKPANEPPKEQERHLWVNLPMETKEKESTYENHTRN